MGNDRRGGRSGWVTVTPTGDIVTRNGTRSVEMFLQGQVSGAAQGGLNR
jgi:hypothetical protein